MNIAHMKIKVVEDARRAGRSTLLRLAACAAVACAGVSAVHAGPVDRDRDAQRAAESQAATQRAQQARENQRQDDARADERRQQENAQNNAEARRSGRMTPDERRDLRRQINEAGIELYPKTPRR